MEDLLAATPLQTCLPPGASGLGQEAFKIMRKTNLMRLQTQTNEKFEAKHYAKLKEEMNGRRQAFDEAVQDYKMGLIRAHERKRK